MGARLTAAERAQAIDLYQTGLTLAQVAARMGRAQTTVLCVLRAAGIPRRPTCATTRLTDAERAEAIRLYTAEQASLDDIARKLHWSKSTIRLVLVTAGIPRRPVGWPTGRSRLSAQAGTR